MLWQKDGARTKGTKRAEVFELKRGAIGKKAETKNGRGFFLPT